MKQFFIITLLCSVGFSSFAQSVNDYAYVVVPKHYDFLKNDDQFQLNSLTKFLFKKYGFDAYMEGLETPATVAADKCNILYANVIEEDNFIRTKLQVALKDCNNKLIYLSEIGDSKNKDFGRAYHEALREAFISISELNYRYTPKVEEEAVMDIPNKKKQVVVNTSQNEPVELTEISSPQIQEDPTAGKFDNMSLAEAIYRSDVSTYRVVYKNQEYSIFDGNEKIGKAVLIGKGEFEVTTSDFVGTATIKGNSFVIEREIKGVSGKVQMIFVKE